MKVNEVAKIAGVSVRTLHHYDKIGLLSPTKTQLGYRDYSSEDLDILQQILFFRELDFSLKDIKEIIKNPSFDKNEALKNHKKMLLQRRSKIDNMLKNIDMTIKHNKGEIEMSEKDKFKGFDFKEGNKYEEEAKKRWGNESVEENKEKIKGKEDEIGNEMNNIYFSLASIRHLSPESDEAQSEIKKWYDFLNKFGSYSLDAFEGLGQMYVDDERFKNNIDKFGDGLAVFMKDAMKVYSQKNK